MHAAPLRTVMTRHSKKAGGGGGLGLGGSGSGLNGHGTGSDVEAGGGGLEREGGHASSMARKRRRGQSESFLGVCVLACCGLCDMNSHTQPPPPNTPAGPVSAFLHKSLRTAEAEQDLTAMAADARFALEEVGAEDNGSGAEGGEGRGGRGGGGGGGKIAVRVEKGVVHYGDMALAKGTDLLVTLARTDDQYVATLQSFNQMEVRVCRGVACCVLGCSLHLSLCCSARPHVWRWVVWCGVEMSWRDHRGLATTTGRARALL